MKRLLLSAVLALALLGCTQKSEPGIVVPSYACSVVPTGLTWTRQEQVYCGRACSRTQDYVVHEVAIQCSFKQWRRE